jgi:hypothetical protein
MNILTKISVKNSKYYIWKPRKGECFLPFL